MPEQPTVDEVREAIIARYGSLSKRLRQVGKYVIDSENDFAIETVATIAERSGVQPSAVVRFAKEFGFDGASAMQRLFRQQLISDNAASTYRERLHGATRGTSPNGKKDLHNFFFDFVEGSVTAIQSLATEASAKDVMAFAHAIHTADTVYLGGVRRSFPVAAYFAYALGKAGKRAIMLDGVGGMEAEQMAGATENDLLLATSFSPYGPESIAASELAEKHGMPIAVITDSDVSPIARRASLKMRVREAELLGFRTLSCTLSLAQTIVIAYVALVET